MKINQPRQQAEKYRELFLDTDTINKTYREKDRDSTSHSIDSRNLKKEDITSLHFDAGKEFDDGNNRNTDDDNRDNYKKPYKLCTPISRLKQNVKQFKFDE